MRRKLWFVGLLALLGGTGRVVGRGSGPAVDRPLPWRALSYRLECDLDTLGALMSADGRRYLPWKGRVLAVLQATKAGAGPVELDLEGRWQVHSVQVNSREVSFEFRKGRIRIRMPGSGTDRGICSVQVVYSGHLMEAAKPPWQDGLVLGTDSLGYPRLGMTCQGSGARSWWPCLDDARSEPEQVSLRISYPAYGSSQAGHRQPALLDMIANGRREGDTLVGGTRTVTWRIRQHINLYNVTFNIGRYVRFVQPYSDPQGTERELEFFVSPEDLNKARSHMAQSVDMMSCYEKTLGPYAFWKDGYKVIQSSYLGMEHQSAVAYGNGFRNNEWGFDFILVHESGHEWWGNSVSASDPSDWWIHEGLTTLMEAVFLECRDGNRKQADAYMLRMRRKIQNQEPMQGPRGRRFAAHDVDIYYKGSWMFYSLRNSVRNDSLWYAALGSAYQKFALRTITSEQMVDHWAQGLRPRYAETLHWWLNHAECPVLEWEMVSNEGDTTTSQVRYRWARNARGFYLPMCTASGQCLNPQAGRWQTMVWKTPGHALTHAERLRELQAEMTNLTKRYLIRVQRLKGGL